MSKLVICAVFLAIVAVAYGRDLHITVVRGEVESKDTFSVDPYVSVTVCKEKKKTNTINLSKTPQWNWSHQFRNVNDNCRVKFHLYDSDTLRDDTIGEFTTTVRDFMAGNAEERTLFFGKHGKSKVVIRAKYI